jgi:hypothetical protein
MSQENVAAVSLSYIDSDRARAAVGLPPAAG